MSGAARRPDGAGEGRKADLQRLFFYGYTRIMEKKKYWLLPLLFLLACMGFILNLFGGHSILPAIYSLIP